MKVDSENFEKPVESTENRKGLRPIDYFIVGVLCATAFIVLFLNFTEYKVASNTDVTASTTKTYTAGNSQDNIETEETASSTVSSETPVVSSVPVTSSEQITSSDASNLSTVNINTATKEQLMELDLIGETKAQRIIDYRNSYGPFSTPEEITNVSGIGDKIFNDNKSRIVVE